MAQPSTEVIRIRKKMTVLLEALNEVDSIADLYADLGGSAFFDAYIDDGANGPADLTAAQFTTAMTALGLMQTWLGNNRSDLVPLLI